MSLFYVQNAGSGKTVHAANTMIVSAADAAGARIIAANQYPGDASWSDSVVTALTETDLAASGSCAGLTFKVIIRGGAAQTSDPIVVSAVGSGTDALDDLAAKLVTALNANADIANAAYAAPNVTVATIADGLGDASVKFEVYDASKEDADLSSEYFTSITDGGIAGADLILTLVADTVVDPAVIVSVGRVS